MSPDQSSSTIALKRSALTLLVLSIIAMFSCKKEPGTTEEFYFVQVKSIVQQHCVTCHHQGGQGMPVILAEDSDIVNNAANIKSATIDPVTLFNKRMPPDGELSDADKMVIQNWFDKGGQITD